ncbi:hypothetical protein [Blautia sp. Marseille-P2398]|uniref:hypothetical protein n=1 Tax=Blautia sp. Marseille-P2398 TaxID=1805476 RepID=UPI002FE609E8
MQIAGMIFQTRSSTLLSKQLLSSVNNVPSVYDFFLQKFLIIPLYNLEVFLNAS